MPGDGLDDRCNTSRKREGSQQVLLRGEALPGFKVEIEQGRHLRGKGIILQLERVLDADEKGTQGNEGMGQVGVTPIEQGDSSVSQEYIAIVEIPVVERFGDPKGSQVGADLCEARGEFLQAAKLIGCQSLHPTPVRGCQYPPAIECSGQAKPQGASPERPYSVTRADDLPGRSEHQRKGK